MRTSTPTSIPTYVERTALPRILVRTRGGEVRYFAYVNGYVRGPSCRVKGIRAVPLYYLSLLDMSGDGGKLQGIWAALISEPPADVYLEGVGTVVLAHHDPQFERIGYRFHWNYDQAVTNARDGDLHAVIESYMLTMFDPSAGALPIQRERKQKKLLHHERQQKKRRARSQPRVTASTASKKELGDLEERINREKHPLFLLLLPGNVSPRQEPGEDDEQYTARSRAVKDSFLAELYFTFLDLRAPWAMSMAWADFLWRRALTKGENVQLTAWFAEVAQASEQGEEEHAQAHEGQAETEEGPASQPATCALFTEAWLCRPQIVGLHAAVQQALREGRIHSLREEGAAVTVDADEVVALPTR